MRREAEKAAAPARARRNTPRNTSQDSFRKTVDWVLIPVVAQLTGYSENAIRMKLKCGVWKYGVFWHHAPDRRVVIHLPTVAAWMGGCHG